MGDNSYARFTFLVTETYTREVYVIAGNGVEARDMVIDMLAEKEMVLDDDDFSGTDLCITEIKALG